MQTVGSGWGHNVLNWRDFVPLETYEKSWEEMLLLKGLHSKAVSDSKRAKQSLLWRKGVFLNTLKLFPISNLNYLIPHIGWLQCSSTDKINYSQCTAFFSNTASSVCAYSSAAAAVLGYSVCETWVVFGLLVSSMPLMRERSLLREYSVKNPGIQRKLKMECKCY